MPQPLRARRDEARSAPIPTGSRSAEPMRHGYVAAAAAVHLFEDFSADFGTWVVFYGPNGGEHG